MKHLNIGNQKIKLFLVFFSALVLMNCGSTEGVASFKIHYENEKAKFISFTANGTPDAYAVFVKGITKTPILGTFNEASGKFIFEPTIPFSHGQSYEIRKNAETIFEFSIASKISLHPELLNIYPSKDTVPENLLKMYFVFSKPMQEVGKMIDYIKVYNRTDGREESIFLALENELWNAGHTQLTLWLDPVALSEI